MKNKTVLPFMAFLLCMLTSRAQQEYLVGTSSVSIEPDSTIFSVALSGYGYPAEGRFSIEWIFRGDMPGNITAMTALHGKFFAADSDHVFWSGTPSAKGVSWKKTGIADGVKALAVINGRIYAVNNKRQLLMSRAFPQKLRWEKIAEAADISTLSALNGKLYATNNGNELMELDPLQLDKLWTTIGRASNIVSMTSHGSRLFAINSEDTLWRIQPGTEGVPQTEIGRYNGVSFGIHIKQIAVVNNRLYAVSRDNKLYVGRHSSDGNLSATAFAVKHNNKTVVLVGVDLTGFNYSLTDAVKEIVFKERHIPKAAILINASHTHFSPSAQAYLAWQDFMKRPDSPYLNNILKNGMVKAIEQAIDNMSPADLYLGRGTTDIGLNRSGKDPDNPHDKTLDILQARNRAGKVAGMLFITGCHAVFNNKGRESYTISANFPGVTRDIIRKKTGKNAIFIQGCAGDINPRSLDHTVSGTQLADDVLKVMNERMTKITGDISYSFDTINIPLKLTIPAALDTNDVLLDTVNVKSWNVETLKQFKIDNAGNSGDLYARRNVNWAELMLNMKEQETLPVSLPEYIHILNIGNWKMVGLSREAVNEYGPAIRNIWPGNIVSVAGYCDDVASYLPNKWHVANHLYEGYDSFFWYGQPGVPALNVFDIVIDGIKRLKH